MNNLEEILWGSAFLLVFAPPIIHYTAQLTIPLEMGVRYLVAKAKREESITLGDIRPVYALNVLEKMEKFPLFRLFTENLKSGYGPYEDSKYKSNAEQFKSS